MRILEVKGQGTAEAAPDLVTLSLDVTGHADQYSDSVRDLNAKVAALRTALGRAGIEPKRAVTWRYSVDARTEYRNHEHVFAGYDARHDLRVELPMDEKLLDRALSEIARQTAALEISLSFSVKDREGLRQKALAAAVKAARAHAEVLAAAAGVRLGVLQRIDYGWSEVRFFEQSVREQFCESSPSPPEPARIQPQNVTAEESVGLTFEIAE